MIKHHLKVEREKQKLYKEVQQTDSLEKLNQVLTKNLTPEEKSTVVRENQGDEMLAKMVEKAQQYPNMGSFIKDKLQKTQELYERKYNLVYPCIYDLADVNEENLGNFELTKHKE